MPPPFYPKGDPALTVRVKRQVMTFVSYMMLVPLLAFSVSQNWLRLGYIGLLLVVVVAVVVNVGFYLAIRFGYTARFADRSLILPQIAIACLLVLVLSYYAYEARVITLMLFFAAFFFGIFSCSTRRYLLMTAWLSAGYAVMLWLKYDSAARATEAFSVELLHFLVLVVILLWMSLLGGYVFRLRANLASKRDALTAALAKLQELASHDELTGLFNRRHLMATMEQQHERARRHGEDFSICILDLDNFKQLNDSYGHQAGDDVLRGFSSRMRKHMRRMDAAGRNQVDSTFGRYGGEEFLLLLPYAGEAAATRCVDRLREAIQGKAFDTNVGPVDMTFSAGIAEFRPGESIMQMLQRADTALYRAKTAGRNRVEAAE